MDIRNDQLSSPDFLVGGACDDTATGYFADLALGANQMGAMGDCGMVRLFLFYIVGDMVL